MNKSITVDLSVSGINELKKYLREYNKWIKAKSEELCKRLAEMGATKAELNFDSAIYDGTEDHDVAAVPQGELSYKVVASGKTVLFVEFGSGLIGYGHPEASANSMGPGTYPGKGHWDDPNGWYYAHGKHTYGNPPNMPMYNTVKELEQDLERVVMEVFKL